MTEPRPDQATDPHALHEGAGTTPEGHFADVPQAADAHHSGGGHDHANAAGHANGDGHEADHGDPPPGPIDWGAWAVSIVGLVAGGVIAVVLGQVLAHG